MIDLLRSLNQCLSRRNGKDAIEVVVVAVVVGIDLCDDCGP